MEREREERARERASERERDRESEKERERERWREKKIEGERERENVMLRLTKNYFALAKANNIFETLKSLRQLFWSLRGNSFRNCV